MLQGKRLLPPLLLGGKSPFDAKAAPILMIIRRPVQADRREMKSRRFTVRMGVTPRREKAHV